MVQKFRQMQEEINDLHLNHTICPSPYNDDFYADFLAELFMNQMVVFSVFGIWARKTNNPGVPGTEEFPGMWDIQCLNQGSPRQTQMSCAPSQTHMSLPN